MRSYRTNVSYIPQKTSILPGTPRDYLKTVLSSFKSRRKKKKETAADAQQAVEEVGRVFGIEDGLWERKWTDLSGGEAQRLSLAIGIGLETAEVLLLDGTYLACKLNFH